MLKTSVLHAAAMTQISLAFGLSSPQNLTLPLHFTDTFHNKTSSPTPPPNPFIFEDVGFIATYTINSPDFFYPKDTWFFISECLDKIKAERMALRKKSTDAISGGVVRYADRKLGGGLHWVLKGANELTYLMVEVALMGAQEMVNAYGRMEGGGGRIRACSIRVFDELREMKLVADGELRRLPDENRALASQYDAGAF